MGSNLATYFFNLITSDAALKTNQSCLDPVSPSLHPSWSARACWIRSTTLRRQPRLNLKQTHQMAGNSFSETSNCSCCSRRATWAGEHVQWTVAMDGFDPDCFERMPIKTVDALLWYLGLSDNEVPSNFDGWSSPYILVTVATNWWYEPVSGKVATERILFSSIHDLHTQYNTHLVRG